MGVICSSPVENERGANTHTDYERDKEREASSWIYAVVGIAADADGAPPYVGLAPTPTPIQRSLTLSHLSGPRDRWCEYLGTLTWRNRILR